jgi:hypothetical protein
MGNNPMMMVDEDGEWFFAALAVGALIGAGSYTASVAFSEGGFNNWSWGGFLKSAGIGAVSGVATAGIGNALHGMSGFGTEMLRAGMHGHGNGVLSGMTGGSYENGFASGGLGSLAGSGFQSIGGSFASSAVGGTSFSALTGGIGAELSGGNFWRGAGQGATVSLLNHYGHHHLERWEADAASKRRAEAYAAEWYENLSLSKMADSGSILSGAAGYQIGMDMQSISRFRPIYWNDGTIFKQATSAYRYGLLSGQFAVKLGYGLRLGGNLLGTFGIAYSGYKFIKSPSVKGGFDIGFGAIGFFGPIGLGISGLYFIGDTFIPGGWAAVPQHQLNEIKLNSRNGIWYGAHNHFK